MNSGNPQPAPEIISKAKKVLSEESGLVLAILYGSVATGTMRPDSDVDVALLFDRPLAADQKIELIMRLESELRRDVDLVDLFALNGTILKQVLSKGRVFIQSHPGALAGLVQRMIYNQADMMPYVTRTLVERQKRFIHG
jgi:predicted nucleotidyltransferase